MRRALVGTATLLSCMATHLAEAPRAEACGGCFHPPPTPPTPQNPTVPSVVTGHRMALAISPTRTVLWDQIQYTGEPDDFAWVLPVGPGAYIEQADDAWFEALDAFTGVRVVEPAIQCAPVDAGTPSSSGYPANRGQYDYAGNDRSGSGFSCGCAAMGASSSDDSAFGGGYFDYDSGADAGGGLGLIPTPAPDPVTVEHRGTVGPYETATLHATDAAALSKWLDKNGYEVPADVQPIVDAYVAEGVDFIALRLKPGAGIREMTPVRVITPGASPTLPLRMVSAGTGAFVAITLYVIAEGRYEPQNFGAAKVALDGLTFNHTSRTSNYATLRSDALSQGDGSQFLTSFALPDALGGRIVTPNGTPAKFRLQTEPTQVDTLADLYFAQAALNAGLTNACPGGAYYRSYLQSPYRVIEACASTDDAGISDAPDDASSVDGTVDAVSEAEAGDDGASSPEAGTTDAADVEASAPADAEVAETDAPSAACPTPSQGEISSDKLACGHFNDLAAAAIGMHPTDVWITRLEANLPHAALASDLTLRAATSQKPVASWITAALIQHPPCTLLDPSKMGAALVPPRDPSEPEPSSPAGMALGALAALALSRRATRRRAG